MWYLVPVVIQMFNEPRKPKPEPSVSRAKEIAVFRKNADDCQYRSHCASGRATKAEWLDLTTQWHWLATQAERQNGTSELRAVSRLESPAHGSKRVDAKSISSSIRGDPLNGHHHGQAVVSSGCRRNNVVKLFDPKSPGSKRAAIVTAVANMLAADTQLDRALKELLNRFDPIEKASIEDSESEADMSRRPN
jgi:hypothetical protein